ncbi:MAG: FtsX-like permease family protein [Collinsella sp.]
MSALPTLAASSEGIIDDKDISSLATPFAFHSEQGTYGNTMYAYLSFGAEDARAVEIGMNEIIADKITGSEWYRTYLTNNAEDARAKRLIGETVQLFINCFILITGAIAVANVFNTLTNSIILRRREFAMLKSIGMGQRCVLAHDRLECFSYAWRVGLGLALRRRHHLLHLPAMMMRASRASAAWCRSAGSSPPSASVIAVLAVSTAYALRKSSGGSIVTPALREDAIRGAVRLTLTSVHGDGP